MILTVDRLAFGYPSHRVGQEVSFSLESGEVLCVLGPNGCGKTTLFKTILRLLAEQAGSIAIDGEDTRSWSRRQIAQAIGYVPQQHDAYFPFKVLEVVLMGRSAHVGFFSAPSSRDIEVATQALQSLHITYLRDAIYTQTSGGERQLTLIARALAQEPRILVMDEPTANLDFGNQVLVLDHIRRLARSGIAIVMSTHDPDHAFCVASRVALLKGGRLLALGAPTDVITRESLRELYGVDVTLASFAGSNGRQTTLCVPSLE